MSIQKPLTPAQKKRIKADMEKWKKMTPEEKKRASTASKPAPWPGSKKK